jgi:hypothetical protein
MIEISKLIKIQKMTDFLKWQNIKNSGKLTINHNREMNIENSKQGVMNLMNDMIEDKIRNFRTVE